LSKVLFSRLLLSKVFAGLLGLEGDFAFDFPGFLFREVLAEVALELEVELGVS